jgi:fructokinase
MNHRHTVVGLGEILWDVFPDGPRFGGAPANFACHAAQLGAQAFMVSAVGQEELGTKALKALQDKGVETSHVTRSEFPTGIVTVQLDEAGKASYVFASNTAWDHLEWTEELKSLADQTDAVCFGSLGQRSEESRRTIQRFVEAVSPETAIRIFDINLRPPFFSDDVILESLQLANVLKLNDDELPILSAMCGVQGSETEQMQELSRRYGLKLVALTRGERGAVLIQEEEISEHPGVPTKVADTVGAGDAFTAALAMGLLNQEPLDAINQRASRIAAFVCSQPGATPEILAELK